MHGSLSLYFMCCIDVTLICERLDNTACHQRSCNTPLCPLGHCCGKCADMLVYELAGQHFDGLGLRGYLRVTLLEANKIA